MSSEKQIILQELISQMECSLLSQWTSVMSLNSYTGFGHNYKEGRYDWTYAPVRDMSCYVSGHSPVENGCKTSYCKRCNVDMVYDFKMGWIVK